MMLYMASVQNDDGRHICGGFLVSEDFVITAAHCDRGKPASVVLGTHDLKKVNNDTMRYTVKRCRNQSFVNEKYGNDIMLLKLSKKARLGNRVQTMRLPRSGVKIKDKAKCRVAGWGFTRTNGEVVDVLQVVDVPVINLEVCKRKWYHRKVELPEGVICAGGYDTDKGFCKGDSGGPLVCNGVAVGVVSFNKLAICDYPNAPNVYTDLSKYLPWIKFIIRSAASYE
ncbi:uncharacterized protein V6R79_022367 [Siganus canaliculatus]